MFQRRKCFGYYQEVVQYFDRGLDRHMYQVAEAIHENNRSHPHFGFEMIIETKLYGETAQPRFANCELLL